jgi:hypothetical protein
LDGIRAQIEAGFSEFSMSILVVCSRKLRKIRTDWGDEDRQVAKSLSVNNIYVSRHHAENNDGCGKHDQRDVAAVEFFIPHQKLSKAVEPRMAHLNNPPTWFIAKGLLDHLISP